MDCECLQCSQDGDDDDDAGDDNGDDDGEYDEDDGDGDNGDDDDDTCTPHCTSMWVPAVQWGWALCFFPPPLSGLTT